MEVIETVFALKRRLPKSNSKEDEQKRLKLDMLICIREIQDGVKRNPPNRTEGDSRKRLPGSKRFLAEKLGVSASQIVAWKKKYSEGGLGNLLAKRSQVPKISIAAESRTIQYLINNPLRLSFAKIHRRVQEEFPEVKYSNLIKHIKSKHPRFRPRLPKDKRDRS